MIIKPTGKYILLKVTEYEDTGNIFIPSHARKKLPKGKILATGDHCEKYKEGSVVIYKKAGTKILPDDQVIAHEDNILMREV